MSQSAVERTLGKLVTDESFRARFFTNPATASFQASLELSPAELDALAHLPKRMVADFSRCLDDRICRLLVEGASGGLVTRDGPQSVPRGLRGTRSGGRMGLPEASSK
jgi:hypothetical protein